MVPGFFFSVACSQKAPKKKILATKGIKIQEFFWMKSQMSTMDYKKEAKSWMKKPKLDENRIKIGENFILHP
jgi:hypothetical protein